MTLGAVPGVINRGVILNGPTTLPATTEMLVLDASGNITTQSIPVASFGALTGSPSDNAALNTALNARVLKAGDTMTGPLALTSAAGPYTKVLTWGGNSSNYLRNDGICVSDNFVIETGRQAQIDGTQIKLGDTIPIGWTNGTAIPGTIDASVRRNATGPTIETRSAGGLRVMDATGSANAPITASKLTFSDSVRAANGEGIRSQSGYLTLYGFNTVNSNDPTMSVQHDGIRVSGKTILGAATYIEAFGSETLKVNGAITASGKIQSGSNVHLVSDAGFASLSNTANRNYLQGSGLAQLWNEGSYRATLDWSTLGTVKLTDGASGFRNWECGAITASGTITTGQSSIDSTGLATLRSMQVGFIPTVQGATRGVVNQATTATYFGSSVTQNVILGANARADLTINGSTGAIDIPGQLTHGFQTLIANPSTVDITTGLSRMVKNSSSGELRLWANDGGSMKSVLLS